jgi:CDP-glucose 4,6-dehydratase
MGDRQRAVEGLIKVEAFGGRYRGRKVLVTGHTGFKGSWLSLWLEALGADVAGFSVDVPSEPSNFELLGLDKRIRHYIGDVRDPVRLAAVLDDFRPEFVFHLAAQALVRQSYADPATTFETNVMGMVNVLEAIRQRPWIEMAVLITSDKVYHNEEWDWGYRETDALGGKDPYSGSKSCADLVAQSYYHSYFKAGALKLAIARAGNVIGGGDWAADRIVPDCIRAWSQNEPVNVRNPMATRPWQHVLEPLAGYLWLGARLLQDPARIGGEAFNFGPDAVVNQTVGELLDAMSQHWTGARWHVPEGFEHGGEEATLLKLSCDKALALLKWTAVLKFGETVAFTTDWYMGWNQAGSDILQMSRWQIEQYTQLGSSRGAVWAPSPIA